MVRVLDILEDYCWLREWEYCRIDGSTSGGDRDEAMEAFNAFPNANFNRNPNPNPNRSPNPSSYSSDDPNPNPDR